MRKVIFTPSLAILVAFVIAAVGPLYAASDWTGEIVRANPDAKSFVVKTATGDVTVMATDKTIYKAADKTIVFGDFKVGDKVQIHGQQGASIIEAFKVIKATGDNEPFFNPAHDPTVE